MTAVGRTAPDMAPVLLESVTPLEWRSAVVGALEDGWGFAGLYAVDATPAPAVRIVLVRGAESLVLTCHAADRRLATVTEVLPAAIWDEREAHDLHGWAFDGHEPLLPLVDHRAPTQQWTVPVEGRDAYQVAVGPIHAGVIESGHFRFHVVGERILHLDLRLFYKHRGLQAAARGASVETGLAHAQRACAADAVANAVAFSQACEAAQGLWPSAEVRRARTLLLELERLYNHLNDIAAVCAGVGFAPGNMLFAAFKERAQRLNRRLTGHRFLFDTITVGHSALRISPGPAGDARRALQELRDDVTRGWRELQFAGSLQERLDGVGAVAREDAVELGAVGPSARAAGVTSDARTAAPRLWYGGFRPAKPEAPTGDVAARLELRGAELGDTFQILDSLLGRGVVAASCEPQRPATRIGVATVESPRGRTLCAVELGDGRVDRLHLRTGSYANWPVLARAVRDQLLPDFPLINKSFELCYACVDR